MPTETLTRPNQAIQFLLPIARTAATEEEGGGDWILALPVGRWAASHFSEGFYEITAANIAQMVANFEAGIPPIKLAGNENHRRGPAVGWVEGMRAAPQGLEIRVRWTELGEELVEKELFVYISSEWYDERWPYVKNTTGEKIPWVYSGFALTNNPFFEELPAVAEQPDESGMLVCTASVPDDPRPAGAGENPNTGGNDMSEQPNKPQDTQPPAGSGADAEALKAENEALKQQIAKMEAERDEAKRAAQLQEIEGRFAAIERGGHRISEAHAKDLAARAMDVPEDKREEFVTRLIAALTDGMVETGERGTSDDGGAAGADIDAKTRKMLADMGVSEEAYLNAREQAEQMQ